MKTLSLQRYLWCWSCYDTWFHLAEHMYWSWCSLCRDCIFNNFSTHWHVFCATDQLALFPKLPGNRGVSGSGMVLGCFVGSKDLLASAVGIVTCLVTCWFSTHISESWCPKGLCVGIVWERVTRGDGWIHVSAYGSDWECTHPKVNFFLLGSFPKDTVILDFWNASVSRLLYWGKELLIIVVSPSDNLCRLWDIL